MSDLFATLFTHVGRVFVNTLSNLLISAGLETIFPDADPERKFIQFLEGILALSIQLTMTAFMAEQLMPFSPYDEFDKISMLAMGWWFMGNARRKIMIFKDEMVHAYKRSV